MSRCVVESRKWSGLLTFITLLMGWCGSNTHCLYLVLNTQETSHNSTDTIFEVKMMVKIYAIEIIFRSHEPFQSYLLTGQA